MFSIFVIGKKLVVNLFLSKIVISRFDSFFFFDPLSMASLVVTLAQISSLCSLRNRTKTKKKETPTLLPRGKNGEVVGIKLFKK